MNTNLTTNQRLVTILLVLLIIFVVLLIVRLVAGWLMMGMNGQTMNNMMSVCSDMMKSFQNP